MQVFIANNEVMFINAQLRKSLFGEIFLYLNSDILIEIRKQEEEKVNFLEKIFLQKRKNTKTLSLDEAAKILKADPKFLDKFEEMYRKADSSENAATIFLILMQNRPPKKKKVFYQTDAARISLTVSSMNFSRRPLCGNLTGRE